MVAWLSAPETHEAACIATILETAGYDVCRVTMGSRPPRSPDVIVLFDNGTLRWGDLGAIASLSGAPLIYWGSRPREAELRLPDVSAALPIPIRSVQLRMVLEILGLPWGLARPPRISAEAPSLKRPEERRRAAGVVVERQSA